MESPEISPPIYGPLIYNKDFSSDSEVKSVPAMWKTQVRSPGQEDPLEKEMATHSSSLAWKIPWMEEPGKHQSMKSLH